MKNKITITLAALALGASALIADAQDNGAGLNDGPRPNDGHQSGREMRGHRPPPSPLLMALDANHDGVIDADEIANASAALKKLDKNGDGKLTHDELRPPRRAPRNHSAGDDANRPDDGPPGMPPGAPPDQQ